MDVKGPKEKKWNMENKRELKIINTSRIKQSDTKLKKKDEKYNCKNGIKFDSCNFT